MELQRQKDVSEEEQQRLQERVDAVEAQTAEAEQTKKYSRMSTNTFIKESVKTSSSAMKSYRYSLIRKTKKSRCQHPQSDDTSRDRSTTNQA